MEGPPHRAVSYERKSSQESMPAVDRDRFDDVDGNANIQLRR